MTNVAFTPDPTATKYHFEIVNGKDVSLASYYNGHAAPDSFDYLPDTRLMDILKTLKQAGCTVRMYEHGNTAQAIEDKPTRNLVTSRSPPSSALTSSNLRKQRNVFSKTLTTLST